MLEIALCALAAFFITLVLTPEIIKIAHQYEMHDRPDERKVHSHKVPRFGGVAIFFGFIITSLLVSFIQNHWINIQLVAAVAIVVVVGFRDDFLPLKPTYKLLAEVGAALLVIYLGDVRITSLHGLLGVHELPLWVSYAVSVFTIIVITNAVNLIDGIDGLAGSLAVLVLGGYGTWFYLVGNPTNTLLCFSACGAVAAYLIFNFQKKIFMGDAGSLLLGFLAATTTIMFLQENAALPAGSPLRLGSPVLFVSCVLALPLFDTIRVFTLRILGGRSPFTPDKNHLHHLLIGLELPHYQATLIMVAVNLLLIGGAVAAQGVNENLGVATGIAVLVLGSRYLAHRLARHQARHGEVRPPQMLPGLANAQRPRKNRQTRK
ncbi:MAG: undecaprenyl/decaprenyl-phosphate alpha-N-acetylglucosaminyl 1-phosphate transferase [Bernardetiaceae bacterium]|jgi:UDP-N-acetylmuramyl pentapeptide phosphotransferase/UDP-N-acetylglucosamine-1-phosphate transferase|nr:undecaprenyl/decaprenyl-phosphate alpha-N-acetylglucosaminyl 1-phosphate transferase [Bernardetiaceae bacterium]